MLHQLNLDNFKQIIQHFIASKNHQCSTSHCSSVMPSTMRKSLALFSVSSSDIRGVSSMSGLMPKYSIAYSGSKSTWQSQTKFSWHVIIPQTKEASPAIEHSAPRNQKPEPRSKTHWFIDWNVNVSSSKTLWLIMMHLAYLRNESQCGDWRCTESQYNRSTMQFTRLKINK